MLLVELVQFASMYVATRASDLTFHKEIFKGDIPLSPGANASKYDVLLHDVLW